MPITIYGFAPSTYTRTARLAAIEKGIDHELAPLQFREPSHFDKHPYAKMPAMSHGKTHLFETLAIVDYIDGAFDGPALFEGRSDALQWISAMNDYVYGAVVGAFAKEAGDVEAARQALEPIERCARFLDKATQDAAGLFLAPMLAYALKSSESLLDPMKRLQSWYRQMSKRASMKETQ